MKRWEVDGFNTTAVIEEMENGGWKHVCTCDYGYAEPGKHLELNKENAKKIAAIPDMIRFIESVAKGQYGELKSAFIHRVMDEAKELLIKIKQ